MLALRAALPRPARCWGWGLPVLVAGVWVVDTPAPAGGLGVSASRRAVGGVVGFRGGPTLRACGWGLPVLVLVCAGHASLNPRGGLRLVPHRWWCWLCGGWGWGSATAHAYDEVCTAGNRVGWWLRESTGGIRVGVRRCAVGVVNTQGSKPGFRFCAAWPRQR